MRGISISSVSTSGLRDSIFSRAIKGSGAVPATSISGADESASLSTLRTMAESSTIRTRIFSILEARLLSPAARAAARGFAIHRRADVFERMVHPGEALGVAYEQIPEIGRASRRERG